MAKRNKERRAHLKRFASDYINTNQGPRALVTDNTKPGEILKPEPKFDPKQEYYSEYLSRRKKMTKEELQNTNIDQWFNNRDRVKSFGQSIPDQRNPFRAKHPKQEVAATLHALWQGERSQGLETYVCVAVLHYNPSTEFRVCLYQNADVYFILEEDKQFIKRSIFYTREKALHADETNKITWISVEKRSPT
jgi:hypothetical protein